MTTSSSIRLVALALLAAFMATVLSVTNARADNTPPPPTTNSQTTTVTTVDRAVKGQSTTYKVIVPKNSLVAAA
jgi:hypothetical protein